MAGQAQRTAWTASVWGQSSSHEKQALKEGENTCCVCLEAAVEVQFQPCAHQLCLECVNRIRAANIFKVSAGGRGLQAIMRSNAPSSTPVSSGRCRHQVPSLPAVHRCFHRPPRVRRCRPPPAASAARRPQTAAARLLSCCFSCCCSCADRPRAAAD